MVDNKLNKIIMENIYDANGQPVEGVLSKEEVEELQKSIEETKAAEIQAIKDEAAEERARLEEELNNAKEALTKVDDKNLNFKNLREAKKTAEEKLVELETQMTDKLKELENKLTATSEKAKVDILIDKMVGDDDELKKKVKFHYDNFKDSPKDEDELKERITNSYILATGSKPSDDLPAGAVSSGGGTPPKPEMPLTGKLESEESKEVAKNLGISDDDLKKHKLI